jgi:ssDNA-binding Zn-finger/Zn-ribbon topoisomerase 1
MTLMHAFELFASYPSLADAHLVRALLVEEGVDCYLADEHLVGTNPLLSNAIGGVRLYVAQADLERAREILDIEPPRRKPELRLVVDNGEFVARSVAAQCPECGAHARERMPRLAIFIAIALLGALIAVAIDHPRMFWLGAIFGLVAIYFLPDNRCKRCGSRWEDEPVPIDESPLASDLRIAAENESCPKCGSDQIARIERKRLKGTGMLLAFIGSVLWLPMLIAVPFLAKHECRDCGRRFR